MRWRWWWLRGLSMVAGVAAAVAATVSAVAVNVATGGVVRGWR